MVRARMGRSETGTPRPGVLLLPTWSINHSRHWKPQIGVRHRLDRHGARAWLDYTDADPETLARAIADGIASTPRYRLRQRRRRGPSGGPDRRAPVVRINPNSDPATVKLARLHPSQEDLDEAHHRTGGRSDGDRRGRGPGRGARRRD
jgi:hypothetical protein